VLDVQDDQQGGSGVHLQVLLLQQSRAWSTTTEIVWVSHDPYSAPPDSAKQGPSGEV
jgi:hypothetical protein